MRLIDADALIAELRKEFGGNRNAYPQFAENFINNAPTVEQATIVTQIDAVKFQEALGAMCVDKDKQIAEQSAEIAHYKAQINELRKALLEIAETNASKHGTTRMMLDRALAISNEALAKTPPQSLQAHDDEVIERCAKVCDESYAFDSDGFAKEIRALKGKQND